MKNSKRSLNQPEQEICQACLPEGIGSVYERIMLQRLFSRLSRSYSFTSVLEYQGLNITKGFDNLIFLNQAKKITLYDSHIQSVKTSWPFALKPQFASSLPQKTQFDLVWNFAVIQLHPRTIGRMITLSRKFILIFVPNFFNFGLPFHQLYHLLTRAPCHHAERGSIYLRTPWGIKNFIQRHNLKVIQTGFIDLPLLPDIGFSLTELKTQLRLKPPFLKPTPPLSPQFTSKLKFLNSLERLSLPKVVQFPFAHHIYVLAQKLND